MPGENTSPPYPAGPPPEVILDDRTGFLVAETAVRKLAELDHARRTYLEVLIDELDGDLARVGMLWDRGSEKTLRRLIRVYGLAHRLDAARERSRRPT